jgi:hypothetical protein
MITVHWFKCGKDGRYCDLEALDLASITAKDGVYVIWHTGSPGRVVRVGCGNIAERLAAHRRDPDILAYRSKGALRVTWAAVPPHQLDAVERYLASEWQPLIADAFPDVAPLAVSSPFAA